MIKDCNDPIDIYNKQLRNLSILIADLATWAS